MWLSPRTRMIAFLKTTSSSHVRHLPSMKRRNRDRLLSVYGLERRALLSVVAMCPDKRTSTARVSRRHPTLVVAASCQ